MTTTNDDDYYDDCDDDDGNNDNTLKKIFTVTYYTNIAYYSRIIHGRIEQPLDCARSSIFK